MSQTSSIPKVYNKKKKVENLTFIEKYRALKKT